MPFEDGPHIGLMCAYLQAVSARKIASISLQYPAWSSKKSLTILCVLARMGMDQNRHQDQISLYVLQRQDLALRDSDKCRLMVKSDKYQSLVPRSADPKVIRYQNTL